MSFIYKIKTNLIMLIKSNIYLKFFLIIFFIPISLSASLINSKAGSSAFSFLKINISARAVAMGSAFTGLADDESSLYYNPAGITVYDEQRIIVEYHNYFTDIQTGFIGFIKNSGKKGNLGFYLSYLNYGDFTKTDQSGNILGDFSGSDILFGVSYAYRYNYKYSIGMSGKLIYEKIEEFSASGIAIDIAAKYCSDRRRFNIGIMLQNIGFQFSSLGVDKHRLPMMIRSGVSYKPIGLPLSLSSDLVFPIDNDIYLALGGEYDNFKPFYIRLGWNSFGSNFQTLESSAGWEGISIGFGLDIDRMQISYAFTPAENLGDSHRITLTRGL